MAETVSRLINWLVYSIKSY